MAVWCVTTIVERIRTYRGSLYTVIQVRAKRLYMNGRTWYLVAFICQRRLTNMYIYSYLDDVRDKTSKIGEVVIFLIDQRMYGYILRYFSG